MAYQKQSWRNLPNRTTPITAERLEHMETQYEEAKNDLNSSVEDLKGLVSEKASVEYVNNKVSQMSGVRGVPPYMSIEYKNWGNYPYVKVQIHVSGVPNPDVLHKQVNVSPGASNSSLKPEQFFINDVMQGVGASLMFNASGWRTSGNVGELRGAQYMDGVPKHDMSTSHWQESDCIAMCEDGRLRAYSSLMGDTMDTMNADHVRWSVGFGPVLIRDGVSQRNHLGLSFWGDSNTAKSSMSMIGQRQDGDIIILYGSGVSYQSGVTWDDYLDIAESESCYVAVGLDRGGSSQLWAKGAPLIPSSDSGPMSSVTSEQGRRKIPDALYSTLPILSPIVPKGVPLNLPPDMEVNNSNTPLAYTDGEKVWLEGSIKKSSGAISGLSGTLIGEAPGWMNTRKENIGIAKANYAYTGKLSWRPDGSIRVFSEDNLNYVVLDGDSWSAPTPGGGSDIPCLKYLLETISTRTQFLGGERLRLLPESKVTP